MPDSIATAPTTAPALKASTAPAAPAPPQTPAAPITQGEEDFEAAFDKTFGPDPDATPKPEPKPAPAAPKADTAKPTVKPAVVPDKDRRFESPKALRDQLAKVEDEARTAKESAAALEAKIKDAEAKGKDATVYAERLTAVEKERDEAHAQIRHLKREADPAFVEKWDKPFLKAVGRAQGDIPQLQVGKMVQNMDTGAMEWKEDRAATWDDFLEIYKLPKAVALRQANALFGDASEIVKDHMKKLWVMDQDRKEALHEENASRAAQEAEQKANAARNSEAYEAARGKAFTEYAEADPAKYKPDPEDEEGNALLDEATKFVSKKPQTPQEAIKYQARLFHDAAAFPRMAHRVTKLTEENAALKETIEEMKNSDPTKRSRRTGEAVGEVTESFEDEMRRTVK